MQKVKHNFLKCAKRRLLAGALAAVMAFSIVPTTAFAVQTSDSQVSNTQNADTPKAPSTDAPNTDTPKAPGTEAPNTDTPKAPGTDAPNTDTPKAPDAEAPNSDTPKAPGTEAPNSDTPKAPGTEAPNSDTPKAPDADAPNTDTPKAPNTDDSSRNSEGAAPAPAMGIAPAILSTVATWAEVAAKATSPADYEWNATVVTIKTATGLAWLANGTNKQGSDGFLGKTVVLAADIDLNSGLVTDYDNAIITATNSWQPIGHAQAAFKGIFDGAGHTVSNVRINDATAGNKALFGFISSTATVKNVGVINSNIIAGNYVGGVVGSNGGTVTSCYSTGALTATGANAEIGGVIGYNGDKGKVINCYNTSSVFANNAKAKLGGVVGNSYGGDITNCYNAGALSSTAIGEDVASLGGVLGFYNYNVGGKVSSCYYIEGTAIMGVGNRPTEDSGGATIKMTEAKMKAPAFVATLNRNLDTLRDYSLYAWKEVASSFPTLSNTPWALPATWAGAAEKAESPIDYEWNLADTIVTIKTEKGLAWLANETNKVGSNGFSGKTIFLAKNINLGDFVVAGYETGATETNSWAPIGTAASPFKGTFDGHGYTVSGVKTNNTANDQGLFGVISSTATVKSVGVINSAIITTAIGGGVVANNGGKVTNCYSTGALTANGASTTIGGVVGQNADTGEVTNCYSTAVLAGASFGGVVGQNAATGKVTNCYYINTAIRNGIGGITDVPANTMGMADADMQAPEFVATLNANLVTLHDFTLYTWEAAKAPNVYPAFTRVKWDEGLPLTWAGAAAKATSPTDYEWNQGKTELTIKTATGLAWFSNEIASSAITHHFQNQTIKLANDIDLDTGLVEGYSGGIVPPGDNSWTPIGNKMAHFSGTFDGQNHTVSGIKIDNIADYQGLFGYISEFATVKNVGVKSSNIKAGGNVGGVVGYSIGKVIDCYSEAVVSGARTAGESEGAVGGVVGKNDGGTVTNCHNTGAVFGGAAGGVVGYNLSQTIKNCYNTGAVTGGDWAGGVVGYSYGGTVTNCHNTGDVIRGYGSPRTIVGGVVGKNDGGTVTNCYNTGKVIGGDKDEIFVGGVVGHNGGGTITNCHNTGAVSATGKETEAGGVAGVHAPNGQITNCYNTGAVFGGSVTPDGFGGVRDNGAVGGVAGTCYGKTTNCYNTGAVSGAATNPTRHIGGVAGESTDKNPITNCYYLKVPTYLSGISGVADVPANTIGMTDADMKASAFVDTLNANLDTIVNTSLYTWKVGTAPNVYPTFTDILWAKKFPTTWKDLALNSVKGTDYEKPFEKSYIIVTAAGLAWFANEVNTGAIDSTGITVTIAGNIELNPDIEVVKGYKDALTTTNSWTPIGTSTNPFKGTFDGKAVHDGTIYTISGVKINNPVNNQGLFGYISSTATVKNVGVVSSDITATAKDNIGGVVGNNEGIVDNCYYIGKVGGGNAIGGVVGNNGGTVTNSYSTATLTGTNAGGVAGLNGGTITNSYSTATLTGTNVGGVVGQNAANCTVVNCYSTGAVNGDATAKAGGVVGTNNGKVIHCYSAVALTGTDVGGVAGANSGTIEKCYYVNDTIKNGISGIIDNVANTMGMADADMKNAAFAKTLNKNLDALKDLTLFTWKLAAPDVYPSFTGTLWVKTAADTWDELGKNAEKGIDYSEDTNTNTYTIKTPTGLAWVAYETNKQGSDGFLGKTIVLEGGIGLKPSVELVKGYTSSTTTDDTNSWMPIGNKTNPFKGTFDGRNNIITGVVIQRVSLPNANGEYQGLFGFIAQGATVKNIGLQDSYIRAKNYVGSIAGANEGTVDHCSKTASTKFSVVNNDTTADTYAGGVVGINSGTVKNCYNFYPLLGCIQDNGNLGGVVGKNTGTVINCYNQAGIEGVEAGVKNIGGVVAHNEGAVTNCYSMGTLIPRHTGQIGGVIGVNVGINAKVTSCYYQPINEGALGIGGTTVNGENTKAMAEAEMKTLEFGQTLNANLEILKDDTLYLWLPISGFYPCFTDARWAPPVLATWAELAATAKEGVDYKIDGDTYTIKTAAGLAWFAREVENNTVLQQFSGKTVKLANDIDLDPEVQLVTGYRNGANETNSWTPIGDYGRQFSGVFDGAGHTVSGIKIYSRRGSWKGLFGAVAIGGIVRNVGVINSNIKIEGSDIVGGVVADNNGTIINCYNAATVTGVYNDNDHAGGDQVGGVAGRNRGTITNCYNTGEVLGRNEYGAVVGTNQSGTTTNCYYRKDGIDNIIGVGNSPDVVSTTKEMPKADMENANFAATLNANVAVLVDATLSKWKAVANGYPTFDKSKELLQPTADNFTFTAPTALSYNGAAKPATVVAKPGITGTGAITVKYYSGTTELPQAPKNAGTYTVKIDVAIGTDYSAATNLTDSKWTFTIAKKALTVTGLTATAREYDGTKDVALTGGSLDGAVSGDTVTAAMPTKGTIADGNVGTNKAVTFTAITLSGADAGNYSVTTPIVTVGITAKAITPTIEAIADQKHTGSPIEPTVVVKNGETVLVKGTDYTVAYADNTNVGTATVTITGKGNYKGTATASFKITKDEITLTNAMIGKIADQKHTGSPIEPTVVVKNGETALVKGTDYTVAYADNTNVGTATVTITGKGNYKGTAQKTFTITKAEGTQVKDYAVPTARKAITNISPKLSNVTLDGKGAGVWKWNKDQDLTADNNNKEQTFKATFTPTDSKNYTTVEVDVKVAVSKLSIEIDGSKLRKIKKSATEALTSSVTVVGASLIDGTDYTTKLTVSKDNIISVANNQITAKDVGTVKLSASAMVGKVEAASAYIMVVVTSDNLDEPSKNTADEIKDLTDNVLNGKNPPPEMVNAVADSTIKMDASEKERLPDETIKALDELFEASNPNLEVKAPAITQSEDITHKIGAVEASGVALAAGLTSDNIKAGDTVQIKVGQVMPTNIPEGKKVQMQLEFSMLVNNNTTQLNSPLVLTITLDKNMDTTNLEIAHKHGNGTIDIITEGTQLSTKHFVIDRAKNILTMKVASFSTFTFMTNAVAPPPSSSSSPSSSNPPSSSSTPGSSNSGSSSSSYTPSSSSSKSNPSTVASGTPVPQAEMSNPTAPTTTDNTPLGAIVAILILVLVLGLATIVWLVWKKQHR